MPVGVVDLGDCVHSEEGVEFEGFRVALLIWRVVLQSFHVGWVFILRIVCLSSGFQDVRPRFS